MKINISSEDLKCLKVLGIIGVAGIIIIITVFLIISYRNSIDCFGPKLSRKTVKNLYLVNSSRIGCCSAENYVITSFYYFNEENNKIYFNVNFIDWLWFCYKNIFYKKRKWKKEITQNQKNNLAIILKSFQKDIEKLQKQSEKEIQDSKEIISDVLKRK